MTIKTNELVEVVKNYSVRSKWDHGVKDYAVEILEALEVEEISTDNKEEFKKKLLNGADDWSSYSWGGCSLVYDGDICERLATPSEQKARHYGDYKPNKSEDWLDVQARALKQAACLIVRFVYVYLK